MPAFTRSCSKVANCKGSDSTTGTFLVEEPPVTIPETYIIPSAVHTPGLNETQWRTDLRVFNPDSSAMELTIKYQPEDTASGTGNHWAVISVPGHGTKVIDDVLAIFPGVDFGDDGSVSYSGSLSITYSNGGEEIITPHIISRTYNDTEGGTFGQFVPAVPVLPNEDNHLQLSGLAHGFHYRTNIRLANMGSESAVAIMRVLDESHASLGNPVYVEVQAGSTTQVNGIAQVAGYTADLNIFSVNIDTGSPEVAAWASVVDNTTGDPVLYRPMIIDDEVVKLWIPGVAHILGENDSEWWSDMTFYNPTDQPIQASVGYIPTEDIDVVLLGFDFTLEAHGANYYQDIVKREMLLLYVDFSKGYFIVTAEEGSNLPHVAGRTYNKDESTGGTFGQNLFTFREIDLVSEDMKGYIPGVADVV